jgi:DHA1 family tetracycline resistance protein-like MFS transporter
MRRIAATSRTSSSSVFPVLFVTVFLDFLGFAMVLPYLYFYASSLGASPVVYGLLLTSYSVAQFAFTPVWGALSDRLGRRKIMLVCLVGSGAAFVLFGIASNIVLLFLARIAAGAMGATVPVAMAYASDITTAQNRMAQMGRLGAAFGMGLILGPAVGGTLSSAFGYAVPAFLAAALAFSNLALGYFKMPESRGARTKDSFLQSFRQVAKSPGIKLLLAAYFITMLGFYVMEGTSTPWLQKVFDYGPFQVGLLFLYIGGVVSAVQGVAVPKLSRMYAPQTLFVAGVASLAAGLALLGFAQDLATLIVSSTFVPLGMGLTTASITTLISLRTAADKQGATLGIGQSVAGISQIIGPSFGAAVFSQGIAVGAIGLPFMVAAAMTVPAVMMGIWFATRQVRIAPRQEEEGEGNDHVL